MVTACGLVIDTGSHHGLKRSQYHLLYHILGLVTLHPYLFCLCACAHEGIYSIACPSCLRDACAVILPPRHFHFVPAYPFEEQSSSSIFEQPYFILPF